MKNRRETKYYRKKGAGGRGQANQLICIRRVNENRAIIQLVRVGTGTNNVFN